MDRERCPSLLTKLFSPVPRVALKPWESKQGVELECEDVSLFQRCSPWDESPARMGTEKIPHVWGTEGQCGCIRCWLEGEQRGPGTHKKFTRSFSVLNFSLHSRGQAQVLLCCPLWGWYSGPDAHTPKSWVALGVFCYNCAHSRAHTDTYRKTFISVTFCGCSCCAVRLSSSLSVLWSGRVLLHGLSQVMWAVLKLNSPPWTRASLRVSLRSDTFLAIHVPSASFFVDTILQLHATGYS